MDFFLDSLKDCYRNSSSGFARFLSVGISLGTPAEIPDGISTDRPTTISSGILTEIS